MSKFKIMLLISVAIMLFLIAVFSVGIFLSGLMTNFGGLDRGYRTGGTHVGTTQVILIQQELHPFINITVNSASSSGGPANLGTVTYDANVIWIAPSNSPVQSIEDLHLIMYSVLNSNQTFGDPDAGCSTHLDFYIYLSVYKGDLSLPSDVIYSSAELTIPMIGVDFQKYPFHLSCIYTY
jgi:hypothetical protein